MFDQGIDGEVEFKTFNREPGELCENFRLGITFRVFGVFRGFMEFSVNHSVEVYLLLTVGGALFTASAHEFISQSFPECGNRIV